MHSWKWYKLHDEWLLWSRRPRHVFTFKDRVQSVSGRFVLDHIASQVGGQHSNTGLLVNTQRKQQDSVRYLPYVNISIRLTEKREAQGLFRYCTMQTLC